MAESFASVLVIAPFTKRLGIAEFRNTELVYFAVKTFRQPQTIESIRVETSKELTNLIGEFAPELIILKELSRRQTLRESHREVVKAIQHIGDKVSVPIMAVSFEDARRELVRDRKPTKGNTFAMLEILFPEIRRFVQFQNRAQEEYYTPMLSAITIGFTHAALRHSDRI